MSTENTARFVQDLLSLMIKRKASDLFLVADYPPAIKIDGKMTPVSQAVLSGQHTMELARALMNEKQAAMFEQTKEANFAINPGGLGRFRVNAYVQQSTVGLVLRVIQSEIPTLAALRLPQKMADIVMEKRGLVLVVGGTGSGKSTSLAAMIRHRNESSNGHIITFEDPIEYVHPHGQCIVSQREIGIDTESWHAALKNALRQAPDVILIGEVRDRETMEHAIAYAETGHLCMATLHASNANQALDRIINLFPEDKRAQVLMDLSLNMRAIISQRLLPTAEGKGRVAAVELLLNSPLMSDLIFRGELTELKDLMKRSREIGMQTFDQAIFDLYEEKLITYEDALRFADSVNDLRLQIKLNSRHSNDRSLDNIKHLDLV